VERPDIIKADMFNLPFRDGSFDTVVCDPPWEIPYQQRHKLLWELCRVTKKGGKLVFNAYWWPKSKTLKVEEYWVGIPNSTWRNISLLIVARKIKTEKEIGFDPKKKRKNIK
jgi:ubiquinone/menaquinone biosynthesis C-methylase UbiE